MTIIDNALILAFRLTSRCAWCKRIRPVHVHHLFSKGMGGGSRVDIAINLCPLCAYCHSSHHNGREPTRSQLLALVAARENRLQEDFCINSSLQLHIHSPKSN